MGMVERGGAATGKTNHRSQSYWMLDRWDAQTGLEDDSFEDLKHLRAPALIACEHEFQK